MFKIMFKLGTLKKDTIWTIHFMIPKNIRSPKVHEIVFKL